MKPDRFSPRPRKEACDESLAVDGGPGGRGLGTRSRARRGGRGVRGRSDPHRRARLRGPGGTELESKVGEAHAVRPGDTLWDLSSDYLNNPWYWPKVWSYNPQLTNPHWIFPGNEVRFYPSDENLPTEVDVASTELIVPDDELTIPGELDESELVQLVGGIQTVQTVPTSIWTSHTGFLARGLGRFSGRIVASDNETDQLDDGSRLYVEMVESASEGQTLAVFRRNRRIKHPVTGETLGYAVELVGTAEVERTTPTVTVARIRQAFRIIERGDYMGEMPSYWGERVSQSRNEVDTDGYVVETVGDVIAILGEHHFVYLDRGRADGVQIGNTLRVLDRGDRLTGRTEGLPWEEIGQVMVVDVQEQSSTAVVIKSLRGIDVGDRVQMVAGR
jgi:hypothetical protein